MTLIWFDILTPKQALFCHALAQRFTVAGYDVAYTTRDYPEVLGVINLLKLDAKRIGRHGGGDRFDKLLASAERTVDLTQYVNDLQPDVGFAFASPESARVAFGLGIPYFTANDSPHSRFVAKLTIPFAEILFTPWIMISSWQKLGIPNQKIVAYHGLDPVAWLRDFAPTHEATASLGINVDDDFVVIRPEEAQASYLAEISDEQNPVTNPLVERITTEVPDVKVVVLCRYSEQRKKMRQRFGSRIILPDRVVDAPSLIAKSALLVGAGGTMNQEGCLLGVPVISCYPGELLDTVKFLTEKQLMYWIKDPIKAATKAVEILRNRDKYHAIHLERAVEIMSDMENPADIISQWIIDYMKQ